ncbi:helix-turn-helix domain-containing protein [Phototrophicus methaneseepsis]
MALKLGISASTVSRLNNGADCDIKSLCQICVSLEASPAEFFTKRVWTLEEES